MSKPPPHRNDVYAANNNPAFESQLAQRSAAVQADFLLPHLEVGSRVLDCGCGPGTITLGLADAVAPGEVVGIDIQPHLIAEARTLAAERGRANVRFEVGSVYELPFPDASFDAAYAHAILIHLSDPLAALREMRRVLRPGGIAGIREGDLTTRAWSPSSPLVDAHFALNIRTLEHLGGSPRVGRELAQLLLDGGFARSEAVATRHSANTLEARRSMVASHVAITRGAENARTAIEQGWASQSELDAMCLAMEEWGDRPDAAYSGLSYSALAWAPL